MRVATNALAIFLAMAFALCLDISDKPSSKVIFVSEAEAIIGRPLTPLSCAGVARRTTRRVVVGTSAAASASAASAASLFVFSPVSYAEDNSCWISAPPQDDVWVKVHDSDRDGNRGPLIWEGKIEAGQEQKITSTQGHIRYSYTRDPNRPYEGENSVGCYDERRIRMD